MKTLAKWSVADYHRMAEAGILKDRRVELLEGEIVEMSPETPIYYTTAKRGAKYLEQLLSSKADVRFNGPITLADSEPEPDIAIVRLPESTYNDHHPYPEDIFWIVEVAKTSLKIDVEIKAAVYAAAEIPEYWVMDLSAQKLIVFRLPQGGRYMEKHSFERGVISPLAFPEVIVMVENLWSHG